MEDRNFFLTLLSVLIAGAFLASVIAPVVATPFSGATVTISSAERQSGSDRSLAGHDLMQGFREKQSIARESAAFLRENAEFRNFRSELTASWISKDMSGPDLGFSWDTLKAERSPDRSAWIEDRSYRKKNPPASGVVSSRVMTGEGVVRFIDLEGGFFGIITGSGDHLLPENLPEDYQVDGLQVTFTGMTRGPAANVRMWGTPVYLVRVNALESAGISATGTVTFIELEGGFFGIVTPAGEKYLPANLPRDFQVDGLVVAFTAREEKDTATIAMWGTPVFLESITLAEQQTSSLTGSWVLLRYADRAALRSLVPGTAISATFGNDGRITGTAGCNQYFASFTAGDPLITVGDIGSTLMYCSLPEGSMEQEATYLTLLGKAATWTTRDGNLVIRDASGSDILIFVRGTPGTSDQEDVLVSYSRTGGFAGFSDHIVVYRDGSATVTRKETVASVTIPDETLRQVCFFLEQAHFPLLNDEYPAPQEGADYFTYSVTYGGKTVVTEDTGIPAVLAPIFEILNGIIEGSAPDDVIPPFTHP